MLSVTPSIQIPLQELNFTYVRSSGPGGQNVNKVNSKAVLRWPVVKTSSISEAVKARFLQAYRSRLTGDGDIIISSQRYRDQAKNTQDCLDRLRDMLAAVAVAPRKRKPTRPTKASVERRIEGKRQQSEKKQSRKNPSER